jgi:hypothetical protein
VSDRGQFFRASNTPRIPEIPVRDLSWLVSADDICWLQAAEEVVAKEHTRLNADLKTQQKTQHNARLSFVGSLLLGNIALSSVILSGPTRLTAATLKIANTTNKYIALSHVLQDMPTVLSFASSAIALVSIIGGAAGSAYFMRRAKARIRGLKNSAYFHSIRALHAMKTERESYPQWGLTSQRYYCRTLSWQDLLKRFRGVTTRYPNLDEAIRQDVESKSRHRIATPCL